MALGFRRKRAAVIPATHSRRRADYLQILVDISDHDEPVALMTLTANVANMRRRGIRLGGQEVECSIC